MTEHIVIMAGGVGSRLYPLSTPEHPKQFIDLLGCGKTLIQLTYERFLALNPEARFWVVTSASYTHFVREQLPGIPDEQIIAEPAARNTAPCIALACWKIKQRYPEANVVVTPADAYVPDISAFASTLRTALDFTRSGGAIVCVGIDFTLGMMVNQDYSLWDYRDLPFNFMGQVCLQNSLVYTTAAVLIVWVFYPLMDRLMRWIPKSYMDGVFFTVGAIYLFSAALHFAYLGPNGFVMG